VVAPYGRTAATTEKLVERLAGDLAEQVPQGDVDRGVTPALHPGPGPAEDAGESTGMRLDGERVLPQQRRSDRLVDVRLDGRGADERLAEAAHAVVGLDEDVDEVAVLG